MTSSPCRVIVDAAPGAGPWNMAVDEALLESTLETGQSVIRLYLWREPTISLGYFQPSGVALPGPLEALPVVRRLTGGGAILHDRELTYSCVVAAGSGLVQRPPQLYTLVHQAWISVLARRHVAVGFRGTTLRRADEPFLCFGRGDEHDLVLRGHKVLGSAQRRRRGALLQHGSLLLERSPCAPDFPGVKDLVEGFTDDGLAGEAAEALGRVLCERAEPGELTEAERVRATALVEQRYREADWQRTSR